MKSFLKAVEPRSLRRFDITTLAVPVLCAALALLAAAPAAFAADAAKPSSNTVNIDNFAFSPATLTVAKGTTVTWVNRDDIAHTVVNDANPRTFKSPPMDSDDKFSFTFSTPGTYKYFCSIHPHMTGVIVVK